MGRHSTLETQRFVGNPECRGLDGAGGTGSGIGFSVYGFSGRNVTDRSHTIFIAQIAPRHVPALPL